MSSANTIGYSDATKWVDESNVTGSTDAATELFDETVGGFWGVYKPEPTAMEIIREYNEIKQVYDEAMRIIGGSGATY